ncbi:solute carrier family 45 member 3-like [Antedon mediterranea]|uniref:solute carrier family 45 member 3-like n=1 Tax=Antedon mediterranea TaxID=105859 RepID=UPI003AF7DC95
MTVDLRFGLSYLIFLNLITCSLELCTSAAFSYLPPMLLEAGFSESGMSVVMAIGPLIALFCVPVMGVMSDKCTSSFGRRKPFILLLCAITLLSLIFIPNGNKIAHGMTHIIPISKHSAELSIMALSVILLDFSSQACYTPLESLLSDPCKTAAQYNRSFAMFSLMMSLGGCLGYLITSINWMDNSFGIYVGDQELAVFAILVVIFIISMLISICIAIDPPLENLNTNCVTSANERQQALLSIENSTKTADSNLDILPNDTHKTDVLSPANTIHKSFYEHLTLNSCFTLLLLPLVKVFRFIKTISQTITKITIFDTYNSYTSMPVNFKKLWYADLFTCIGIMGFRLYFTDFMGESLYHGNPDAAKESANNHLYEEGIRMGSWGLLLNSVTSMIFSASLEYVINMFGSKAVYVFGMAMFTMATFFILFLDNIAVVIFLASLTGFGNVVVTTLPYTVLTMYHEQPEVFFPDVDTSKLLNRKGTDIALLDGAYFLAEVVASFLFGVIVELTGTTTSYIACSFIFGVIGLTFVFNVKFS